MFRKLKEKNFSKLNQYHGSKDGQIDEQDDEDDEYSDGFN